MPRYSCQVCDMSFKTTMDLARHYRWKHRRDREEMPEENDFVCEQCERSFGSIQGLNLHKVRMHTKKARHLSTTKKMSEIAAPAVSFCPCCGTNIRLFAQALAAIGGLHEG